MHLIQFVVACQRVHHQVYDKPIGHFALAFATWHCREQMSALIVDGPGSRPIVCTDNDAGNAVIGSYARPLNPDATIRPTPWK